MNFKPIDEMSLRQLFSTQFAKELLGLSYIGPVLDQNGKIDPSPDAMILDMRKSPYRPLRCEFKFSPKSADEFSHNGKFDIAVVWNVGNSISKEKLLADLLAQNGCFEILALDEIGAFHALPEYDVNSIKTNFSLESLKNNILRFNVWSLVTIYIAAKLYPHRFNLDAVIDYLAKKYPAVAAMKPQGRSNAATSFLQTEPPLIQKMYGKAYQWNQDFDSVAAAASLSEWITVNFRGDLPTAEEIKGLAEK